MVFEALQRFRKINLVALLRFGDGRGTTFIKRYKEEIEDYDAASICCQVFERIARESRKFGLGLVLSSQRPSELSPTVLSQCNSFLLHRHQQMTKIKSWSIVWFLTISRVVKRAPFLAITNGNSSRLGLRNTRSRKDERFAQITTTTFRRPRLLECLDSKDPMEKL
jgi:hypothetical protein